jgi:hypothetical protein
VVAVGALAAQSASSSIASRLRKAHAQRAEETEQDRRRRSIERCFNACAEFYTDVRAFRNGLRPYGHQLVPRLGMEDISAPARTAHGASPLVFLTVEDPETTDATAHLIKTMSEIQDVLDDQATASGAKLWAELNEWMRAAKCAFHSRPEIRSARASDWLHRLPDSDCGILREARILTCRNLRELGA